MCNVQSDDLPIVKLVGRDQPSAISGCLKCKSDNVRVLLRQRHPYCEHCFLLNLNHKYRAVLGKNRLLRGTERVLIVYAGDHASTSLLDLIHNSLKEESHKRKNYKPIVLYVNKTGLNDTPYAQTHDVRDLVDKYNFQFYSVHITNEQLDHREHAIDQLALDALNEKLNKFQTLTAKQDYLRVLENNLRTKIARELSCKYILTSETSNELSASIISAFAHGRGDHIQLEVGLVDTRDCDVSVIRPLREFTLEEVQNYCEIKQLTPIFVERFGAGDTFASISNLTEKFIDDLQTNFPATISTICKISDKIVSKPLASNKSCTFCRAPLAIDNASPLTSASQTLFSRLISTNPHLSEADNCADQSDLAGFCYACARTFDEFEPQ